MQRPAVDAQRLDPVGDHHPRLDRRARGDDRGPVAVLEPPLAGQLRRDLAEQLGLQLGQVGQRPRHAARGVVLGQPVGGDDEREHVGAGLAVGGVVRILGPVEALAQRVALLAVERVVERRLVRLVVDRQRTVHQPGGHEQPAQAVRVQGERLVARQGIHPARLLGRGEVGRLVRHEVDVVAQAVPFPLLGIPPGVALALRPRVPLGIGRGAVVEDARVQGPRPTPLRGDPVLLGVRLAARGLVDAVPVDPAVDPRAAAGGSVGLQVLVLGEANAVGVAAVDLSQHRLGVGLVVRPLHRVVPGQVEDRPVAGVLRRGELLPDAPAQVMEEVQVRPAVLGRLHRLVVPLQQPLGVGERAVLLGVGGGG